MDQFRAGKTGAFIGILLVCLALLSCNRVSDSDQLKQQLIEHKVHHADVWKAYQNRPLIDTVEPASDLLLDYLHLDNRRNGYDSVPQKPAHWQLFAKDVVAAIDDFPPQVRRMLDDNAIGIFLVSNLGSSAFTDFLVELNQRRMGVIVLDVEALDRKANEWASWKENTPFVESKTITPEIRIASDRDNSRRRALAYVILHELGHLVGGSIKAHPDWTTGGDPADYAFSNIAWKKSNDSTVSRSELIFPERSSIRFYADKARKTAASDIPTIYLHWQKTDFVTLYAAMNVYDDFAETFAMYVHVVLQHRPWQLTLVEDGNIIATNDKPVLQERCKQKKAYMDALFAKSMKQL